jgi:hypothetical protein
LAAFVRKGRGPGHALFSVIPHKDSREHGVATRDPQWELKVRSSFIRQLTDPAFLCLAPIVRAMRQAQ